MQQLSGHELLALQRAPSQRAPLLLDVREPWEIALAAIRIEGCESLAIPMNEVPARLDALAAARDGTQPVVCICHHGMRSAQVVAFLERQGWADVYNLAGGIAAWSAQVDPGVPTY